MSFMDKIKGLGRERQRDDDVSPFDEIGAESAGAVTVNADGTATLDMNVLPLSAAQPDTSIITEAAPSELGSEFSPTRIPQEQVAAAAGSGLPLIGHRPVADQQRTLGGMIVLDGSAV